jgi:hypothetical protein
LVRWRHDAQLDANDDANDARAVGEAHDVVQAVGAVAAKRDALAEEARTYATQLADHDAALREQSAAEQVPRATPIASPRLTSLCLSPRSLECTICPGGQRREAKALEGIARRTSHCLANHSARRKPRRVPINHSL